MKLFDVVNFDVIHFVRLGFAPGPCDFVSKVSSFSPILAIAEMKASGKGSEVEGGDKEASG